VPYQRADAVDLRLPGPDADDLTFLLFVQDGVISRRQALRFLSPKALQHRLEAGRWLVATRGIYLTQSGSVSWLQKQWIAVLAVGAGRVRALLGGASALQVLGMRGYRPRSIHVLLPAGRRDHRPPAGVVVHRTRHLPGTDIHRRGRPPCTMPARSLVDAAQWATSDNEARAVIAAGFQQRLVAGDEIHRVLERMPRARRRVLIRQAADDARGGAEAISEAAFLHLCRRAGLPEPLLQVRREDASGRRRYLDAYFPEWQLHVEIDGGQHMEVQAWWADMKRQNDLWVAGDRVLRFPAWVVRSRPDEVAAQVRAALVAAGWQ
jgi:very-short-patch-repair endonuclease